MLSALNQSAVTIELKGSDVALIPLLVLVLLGIVFLMPGALFRRWYFYRRRLRKNVITAEYAPPAGFNPAEIGYMFDGKLREQEVGATIIHLIRRGNLHIKRFEDGSKRIFAGPKVSDDLKIYEQKLVDEADQPDGVKAEQLIKRFSATRIGKDVVEGGSKPFIFTQLVHADLQERGLVRKRSLSQFIAGSLRVQIVLVVVTLYVPFTLLWGFIAIQQGATDFKALFGLLLLATIFTAVWSPAYFVAAMIVNLLRGRVVGREWIITPKLKSLWPQIVGYRQYVSLVESERLEFYSKDLQNLAKNDTLPYAVALGFVKNWKNILN